MTLPKDPKKIRDRITRYEKTLKSRNHRDGSGLRFLLGPLYLLVGDAEGAEKSYAWYKRKFPDDMPEAFNHLCWVLTLLRTEKENQAKTKFRELVFSNLYSVPLLLKEPTQQHSFRHSSNWEYLSYITDGPCEEIFSLFDASELEWIRSEWRSKSIQDDVVRFIEIHKLLDSEARGIERSRLVDEAYRIATGRSLDLFDDNDNVISPFK
ncbi:MAG: hypothetical protein JNL01_14215 [Bdellovibrionales bacterium]|nr:hypothetical protein [Bdellovibrionales bacterium]